MHEQIRIGTQKPVWDLSVEVKKTNILGNFRLRIKVERDRLKAGQLYGIKQETKRKFKSPLSQARLNGHDDPTDKKSWSKVINTKKYIP